MDKAKFLHLITKHVQFVQQFINKWIEIDKETNLSEHCSQFVDLCIV